MYADANGVTPKGIYLTTLALVILVTRPMSGRLGDRLGHRRVFLPCLLLISLGLGILATGGSRASMIASAIVFGVGFGTAYPVYVGYVMRDVSPARRGAAPGSARVGAGREAQFNRPGRRLCGRRATSWPAW